MATPFLRTIGWWAALFAVYLLLAGKTSGAELVAGAALAVIATIALTKVRLESGARFELKAAWLRPLASVPWQTLRDCFVVLAADCARVFRSRGSGRFSEREFNPGGKDSASSTRRAVVVAAVSVAPNSIVLGIDREAHRLLLHELVPTKNTPRDPNWPL